MRSQYSGWENSKEDQEIKVIVFQIASSRLYEARWDLVSKRKRKEKREEVCWECVVYLYTISEVQV